MEKLIFQNIFIKKLKTKKKYTIIDLTRRNIFKKDRNSYSVSIGQFGKIISILKKNKCKKVLFAGKVHKPNFSKIKFDLKGLYYIPRIIKKAKLGDAALLKEIINILKNEKIQTISSTTYTPELSLSKGNYSKHRPDKKDEVRYKQCFETTKEDQINIAIFKVQLVEIITLLLEKKGRNTKNVKKD